MRIKRNIDIEILPTPKELAQSFCAMDSNEQATFFNEVYKNVKSEWEKPFCMQLQSITDSLELSAEGREIMREIGEYSELRNEGEITS